MKKNGGILIEVLVSIAFFSMFFLPLLELNIKLFQLETRAVELEKQYSNFLAIKKQFRIQKIEFLKNNKGKHSYKKNKKQDLGNTILKGFYFPYEISKNVEIEVDIFETQITSMLETRRYMSVEVLYTINNKKFISREFIGKLGENNEK